MRWLAFVALVGAATLLLLASILVGISDNQADIAWAKAQKDIAMAQALEAQARETTNQVQVHENAVTQRMQLQLAYDPPKAAPATTAPWLFPLVVSFGLLVLGAWITVIVLLVDTLRGYRPLALPEPPYYEYERPATRARDGQAPSRKAYTDEYSEDYVVYPVVRGHGYARGTNYTGPRSYRQ